MYTHNRLVNIVTEYDIQQSKKKNYNRYALPQYLGAINDVMEGVESGESLEVALKRGFCGSLLRHIAKKLNLNVKYERWD